MVRHQGAGGCCQHPHRPLDRGNCHPLCWTGDETGEGRPFTDVLSDWSSAGQAPNGHGILIGPEGGFTHNEFATLDLMAFVTRVDLGPRILRAETATLAALTCWQALLGDWRRLKSMKHSKN